MLVGKRGAPLSEINVTPFVDVMLVLLIIFMVTAPLLTQGLEVDLPQTRTVDTLPTDADHLVLTVTSDGTIFLDEYAVPLADLAAKAKAVVAEQKRQLYLRADKTVPYGLVVAVMGELKSGGVEKLGVVAEETKLSEITGLLPQQPKPDTTSDAPGSAKDAAQGG